MTPDITPEDLANLRAVLAGEDWGDVSHWLVLWYADKPTQVVLRLLDLLLA